MARTMQEIIDQADKLSKMFEEHEPDPANFKDATPLRAVRAAFIARTRADEDLATAVAVARGYRFSWSQIGTMLGTSGEAARQRYSRSAAETVEAH